jgi:hypothetical protein
LQKQFFFKKYFIMIYLHFFTTLKPRIILGVFLALSFMANAQKINIHELMERTDLKIQEVEAIADAHFKVVGTERGSGYKQYQRWLYEKRFHLREDGSFISPEEESIQYQRVAGKKTSSSGSRATTVWSELGPSSWVRTSSWNPGVGRLTSVAIHPANEAIIYVSSPGGGIWKSINSGASWTPLIDFVNSAWMNIFNLCIDPSNQNTVYAGLSSGGVLKSINAGVTWATTGSGPSTIRKILVHPTNSNIVFAAASNGLWRSTNGGTSWTSTQSTAKADVEFNPTNPNIMISSGSSSASIWRSTDNGVTWTTITLPATGRTLIGVSPNDANVVYVVQASGSTFGTLYKSTDAGLTYIAQITGSPAAGTNFFGYDTNGTGTTGQATYDMAICVDPLNVNEVHIAGIICWKSTNGGTSFVAETAWSLPNSIGYNHADVHSLEWINNTIYSTSDGGVYKSINNGDDWTDLSSGIAIRQFYRIACAKTNANVITGGAQDNGSTFRQSGGNWVEWLGADGMDAILSPTNAAIAIGTSQNGSIYKTTNSGASYSGLSNPSAGNWVTPLAIHPTNHDTVYGGWTGVYRSVNGGTSWTLLSGTTITTKLSCLVVAPSDTRYIYASEGTALYRTSDAGATWTSITATGSITSICISPLNPQKIWITTSATSNHVQVSTNMGTSWTVMTMGLPALAARSIVVEDNANEGLYVGMNIGVFYRDNINTTWTNHATGLPLVAINEVEIQKSSGKLRVATYGRGVWESDLQSNIPTQVPSCATLSYPLNNAINTPTTVNLAWSATSAFGYRLTVGTTPGGNQILNNVNIGNVNTYQLANLATATTFYVKIIPYNNIGDAQNCIESNFRTYDQVPSCAVLSSPLNGAMNLPRNISISWNTPLGIINGYKLLIGTTSGGGQILNNVNVGNVNTYQLTNLATATTFYVKVIPYNNIGDAQNCIESNFRTYDQVPSCTMLSSPINGATNVLQNVSISWSSPFVFTNGYKLRVGTTSGGGQILNNINVGNVNTYTFSNLPLGAVIFIKITPFNALGDALGCIEESITITSNPVLCIPTFNTFGCNDGDVIARVQLNTLDNNSGTGCPGGVLGYSDYRNNTALTTTLNAGNTYNCQVWAGQYPETYAAWIDFNSNYIFETSERIGYTATAVTGSGTAGVLGSSAIFPINFPCNAPSGTFAMRIRCAYSTTGSVIQPCGFGNGIANGYGEVEDYLVTVNAPTVCAAPKSQSATNITTTNATLNWLIGCAETQWDVHVALAGGGSPTGTASNPSLTATTLNVTNLISGTNYEFWVRAICPTGGTYSAWVGPFIFNTLLENDEPCNAISLPINGAAVCGNSTFATVTANEPPITCAITNRSFWYKFTTNSNGNHTLTLSNPASGNLMNTWVTVYNASICPTPLVYTTILACTQGANGIANNSISLTLNALTANTTYLVYITDKLNSFGNVCLKVAETTTIVQAKVFLSNLNSGTMGTYINTMANFPLSDPYSTTPLNTVFTHVNNPTVATTTSGTINNNAVVDWVFLELRTGVSGSSSVNYTKAALLQNDGDIVDMDGLSPVTFPNTPAGNYYVAVRHRNHLGFRTNAPIALSSTSALLDFTNNSTPLYGIAPISILSPTLATMNAGDANSDGSIDSVDSALWEAQNGAFDDYTLNSDYNLDGSIDSVDSALWEINNGKYQELD